MRNKRGLMFTSHNSIFIQPSYRVVRKRHPMRSIPEKNPCASCIDPILDHKPERLDVVFENSSIDVLKDNFDTGVMKCSNNVFVLLYDSNCSWCKIIAPDFIKAKEMLDSNSNIKLMVIDAVQWPVIHPNVQINGFPTILLFKKDDKANPIEYKGDRGVNDLVQFVKMHVNVPEPVEIPNIQLEITEHNSRKLIDLTNNFDTVVMNNDNDVLVMFYAPWCDWSKRMMPDIESIVKQYSGNNKICFARMDATVFPPEHDKVIIYGYPLVHLFKGNNKGNPVEYIGNRTKDDIVMFIENNAVNK